MNKDKNRKILAAMASGAGVGWIVALLIAMVLALLMLKQVMDAHVATYTVVLAPFAGSVSAAAIASKRIPENRLLMCLASSGLFFVTLACAGIMVFGGINGGVLPSLALTLSAGIIVFLLGNKGKGHKRYRVGKRYR